MIKSSERPSLNPFSEAAATLLALHYLSRYLVGCTLICSFIQQMLLSAYPKLQALF